MDKSIFLKIAIATSALVANVAHAGVDCDSQVPAFVDNIQNQIIIVGELHGSKEMPAFAGKLLCYYAKKKVPVLLGFELPTSAQSVLNAYHISQGTKEDKDKLFSAKFWEWGGKTGQASSAIFDLIELNRKIAREDGKTMPFFYQTSESLTSLGNNKEDINVYNDLTMAANIYSRAIGYKDYKVIVLSGNRHAKKGDEIYSMASFLEKHVPIFSIDFNSQGGRVRNCMGAPMNCDVHEVKPRLDNKRPGYDALVEIGELHPAELVLK